MLYHCIRSLMWPLFAIVDQPRALHNHIMDKDTHDTANANYIGHTTVTTTTTTAFN